LEVVGGLACLENGKILDRKAPTGLRCSKVDRLRSRSRV